MRRTVAPGVASAGSRRTRPRPARVRWRLANFGLCLALAALVGALVAACDQSPPAPPAQGQRDDRGRIVLTVAYSPEKSALFERLVTEFNKENREYAVLATKLEMADMLPRALAGEFTAISPDSAIWLGTLDQQWLAQKQDNVSLVGTLSRFALSPVVIAAWESVAQDLGHPKRPVGWSELVARATTDPGFRWSHPSTTTAAGLLTVTAEFYAAKGKTSNLTREDLNDAAGRDYVRRVERTIRQYGAESEDQVLTRLLDQRNRTLDAFVGQEALVVRFNRQTRGEKLVAIYPREGTLWMDHPLALLEGPWVKPELRRGFQALADYLRSPAMQRIVLQEGYRPADLRVSLDDPDSQIKPQNGVDATQPQTMLQVPPYGVMDSIRNAWVLLKRPANIYLVADTSGSMEGEKLTRAQEALGSFVQQVKSDSDRLALVTFASEVRPSVPLGAIGDQRGRLTSAIGGLKANGQTALLDSILYAAERLAERKEPDRINAVLVMTDGRENASQRISPRDAGALVTALKKLEAQSGTKTMVFAVAYGTDADLDMLQRIASATNGQAYKGEPETIRKLYQLLSAFF